MAEARSTYCDECWPFHSAEVKRLAGELEITQRHVRRLNKKHEIEHAQVAHLEGELAETKRLAANWVVRHADDEAANAALEGELAELREAGKILVRDNDRAYAANAEKDAALREFGHHDQDCAQHRQRFDDLEHCHCGLSLALSDTGEGWLPPEVREQVREALAPLKRAIINGMRMQRWRNTAVVSLDVWTLHRLAAVFATLDALEEEK